MSNLTDRELLENAAKAAGIEFHFDSTQWDRFWVSGAGFWNPLTDDGDALRLAVKLGIYVSSQRVEVWRNGKEVLNLFEHGNDPYAATRRAIVRAAAEIGWGMV